MKNNITILKLKSNINLKNIINFPTFKFSSKIYSQENIKSQKVFKFTTNSDAKKELKNREKYLHNLSKIQELKISIQNEDYLTYNTSESSQPVKSSSPSNKVFMMKKSSEDFEDNSSQDNSLEEDFKPINASHKNKKLELSAQMKNLIRENEEIMPKSLKNNFSKKNSSDSGDKIGFIRSSMIKDIFSQNFSFNNRFLTSTFYEQVNKVDEDKPFRITQDPDQT